MLRRGLRSSRSRSRSSDARNAARAPQMGRQEQRAVLELKVAVKGRFRRNLSAGAERRRKREPFFFVDQDSALPARHEQERFEEQKLLLWIGHLVEARERSPVDERRS